MGHYPETTFDNYEAHFEWRGIPEVNVGDVLQIEHNSFGKATFFKKDEWAAKCELALNWILYFIIGLITLMSFAFYNVQEQFTHKITWITWILNLFGFAHYFLS